MTYRNHLTSLIKALLKADQNLSYLRISMAAQGVGRNWVSEFMTRQSGTMTNAESVVQACRLLCPKDESGAHVRQLLQFYDHLTDAPVASSRDDAA